MSQKSANSELCEIDFLPARFREKNTQRKVNVSRIVVLAVLVAIVPALLAYQFGVHHNVRGQLSELRVRYNRAKIEETRLNRLQSQLVDVSAAAELYTFLGHPWPTTQLLNATTRALPTSITLTELTVRVVAKKDNPSRRRANRGRVTPGNKEVDDRPAAQRDLDTLRDAAEGARCVISLSGETRDTSALYAYIGNLADEPLFERADLESVEVPQGKTEQAAKFRARIVVRPGYGLPHGPTGGDATVARASAVRQEGSTEQSVKARPADVAFVAPDQNKDRRVAP